jgi:hypothetical protein
VVRFFTVHVARTTLIGGLAVTFGGLAAVLAVTAVSYPVSLVAAVPLAGLAALLWYHASGRLAAYIRRRARRRDATVDGVGARTRGARTRAGSGTGAGAGTRSDAGRRSQRRQRRRRRGSPTPDASLSREEASSVLGVDPDAGEAAVRTAYRERVKAVHPDRGGDAEAFDRVNRAYERLTSE